jgi:hypothetical protein
MRSSCNQGYSHCAAVDGHTRHYEVQACAAAVTMLLHMGTRVTVTALPYCIATSQDEACMPALHNSTTLYIATQARRKLHTWVAEGPEYCDGKPSFSILARASFSGQWCKEQSHSVESSSGSRQQHVQQREQQLADDLNCYESTALCSAPDSYLYCALADMRALMSTLKEALCPYCH